LIVWVIAGLLGLATGLRIGWALANEQSVVSSAMIVALGSLGAVAALSWQPLTLLVDTMVNCPNLAMGLSQVALISCAAGSCVMITSATSGRPAATNRRIAAAQYAIAVVVAAISLAAFFARAPQPEMSPSEYLRRSLASGGVTWLLPLVYVLLALSLVAWAGLRHSSRSRRGRALFVFTIGVVLMLLAGAAFLVHAVTHGRASGTGIGMALLGCAMVAVAAGALLPGIEDWFGARREQQMIEPILAELGRRHPEVGIGVRARGPRVFRVAEKMSLISDALFLEATEAMNSGRELRSMDPTGDPDEQARSIARWIEAGRGDAIRHGHDAFPGLTRLRQPEEYSDREWILAIAAQYRNLSADRQRTTASPARVRPAPD